MGRVAKEKFNMRDLKKKSLGMPILGPFLKEVFDPLL